MNKPKTTDFTVTIKNIPSEELMSTWNDALKELMKHFGEIADFSNNVTIDFNAAMDINPEGFYSILSHGMTFQMVSTAVKVIKE